MADERRPWRGEDGMYGFRADVVGFRSAAAAVAQEKAEKERMWQIVQAQFARPTKPAPRSNDEPPAGDED